jgi:hypothetical protein
MGLLLEPLSFQVPEVKTSGYNIARPYETGTEYFPEYKSTAPPDCRGGGVFIWK